LSRKHAEPHLNQLVLHTVGIVFLGTPHHGADLAKWANFGTFITKLVKPSNSNLVAVLGPGSEVLARVQDGFHTLLRERENKGSKIEITCFFEELPLPVVGKVRSYYCCSLPSMH
jgi:hypothetical protein